MYDALHQPKAKDYMYILKYIPMLFASNVITISKCIVTGVVCCIKWVANRLNL